MGRRGEREERRGEAGGERREKGGEGGERGGGERGEREKIYLYQPLFWVHTT